jgi:hypothetical protein
MAFAPNRRRRRGAGNEINDFVKAFKGGMKLWNDMEWQKARTDYYKFRLEEAKKNSGRVEAAFQEGRADRRWEQPGGARSGGASPPEAMKKIIDENVPEEMRDYAYSVAQKESTFNPTATSKTGATGLFQFTRGTGQQYGLVTRDGDFRSDPVQNTRAFVRLTQDNAAHLRRSLGREPTQAELAVAHQQGAEGATALITGRGTVNQRNLDVNQGGDRASALGRIKNYYGLPDKPLSAATPERGYKPAAVERGALPDITSPATPATPPAPQASYDADNPADTMPAEEPVGALESEPNTSPSFEPNNEPTGALESSAASPDYLDSFDPFPDDVFSFSSGGMVPEEEEFDYEPSDVESPARFFREDQARMQRMPPVTPEVTDAPQEGSSPDSSQSPSLGEAIGAGLKFLQRAFGLESQGALPQQADQGKLNQLMRGAGAMSTEDAQALRKTIDPENELTDSMANIAGLRRVYEFHLLRGDTTSASRAAASLLQYSRMQSMRLGALAEVAVRNGDQSGAVKALIAAHNQIPDGMSAKVEGDTAQIVNDQTGKVEQQFKLTPQVLLQAALRMRSGAEFYGHLARFAGGRPAEQGLSQEEFAQRVNSAPASALPVPGQGTAPGEEPTEAPVPSLGGAPSGAPEGPPAEPPQDPDAPDEAAAETQGAIPAGQPRATPAEAVTPQSLGLPPPPSPPPMIDVSGMSTQQRQQAESINRQRMERFRDERQRWDSYYQAALKERNADRRQQNSQQQQERSALAASARQDQVNALQTERGEKSQIRVEQFRTSRPRDLDTSDRNVVKQVEESVYDVARNASDGQLTPERLREQFGVRGVQRLRDATIDIFRYNHSLPLDTAAAIVHYIARPITAETTSRDDVDYNPTAAPYTVTKLRGLPGVENGAPRVVISANNREFPDIVLPASTMQQLDILRGERTRMRDGAERKKAEKGLAATATSNAIVDKRRALAAEAERAGIQRPRSWRQDRGIDPLRSPLGVR